MFSPDGTLISASAAPHCGGTAKEEPTLLCGIIQELQRETASKHYERRSNITSEECAAPAVTASTKREFELKEGRDEHGPSEANEERTLLCENYSNLTRTDKCGSHLQGVRGKNCNREGRANTPPEEWPVSPTRKSRNADFSFGFGGWRGGEAGVSLQREEQGEGITLQKE